MITVKRYHDISCGHRVHGHESKCAHLHGHNYRFTFECQGPCDAVGRVIDFSVIKETLCQWLEDHWDHRFLIWEEDPLADALAALDATVVKLPVNPTAENLACLMSEKSVELLAGTGVRVISIEVEETRKCSASWKLFDAICQ